MFIDDYLGGVAVVEMKKFYVWIIILLLFDLGTKVWVGRSISIGESIQVNDILSFVLVHNKGMGFGMFSSYPHLVLLLQFIGVIAITWFLTTISSKHTILQSVTKFDYKWCYRESIK